VCLNLGADNVSVWEQRGTCVNQTITEEAKRKIVLLESTNGCSEFNELITQIRDDVFNGTYTYAEIGVTEIKLIELGLNNARLACVKSSPGIFADQRIVQNYARELARLRTAQSHTRRVA
jgi:hypothetical protein